jgi:glycosyltransferase involved in cell wall biosynthesis
MKTSVVIPTKNSAATIGKCLTSLMPYYEQGYIGEIVVVDGHSTDGTLEIIKKFPVKMLFDEGHGEYVARDIGWRETSGEWLLFIDNDAYLGDNFFPGVLDFFSDDRMGIVGAQERAVVTNGISKTIGEWWLYHADNLRKLLQDNQATWSWFQRLYHRVAWGGEKYVTTSGPCYLVRRACLEVVGGFELPLSADIFLSRKIVEKGWKATWWLDAPLNHYPQSSVRQLIRQRRHYGKADAVMQRESLKMYQKAMLVIARLGTPLIGLILALRFRNIRHLWLFPLAHYAWIAGYLRGVMSPGSESSPSQRLDING